MIVVGKEYFTLREWPKVDHIKYYSTVKSGKHKGKLYLCRRRSTACKFHNAIDAKYWIDLHKLEDVELFRYEYSSCILEKP